MNAKQFSWSHFFIRLMSALALVFASYNPAGLSFYHWVIIELPQISPLKVFASLCLIIVWVIFIRATLRSLGWIGITLAGALFGSFFWLLIDWNIVPTDNLALISYISQFMLCLILALGMSWSHVRRRMSGQVDTDDIDQ